jgi:hypothetical protein
MHVNSLLSLRCIIRYRNEWFKLLTAYLDERSLFSMPRPSLICPVSPSSKLHIFLYLSLHSSSLTFFWCPSICLLDRVNLLLRSW